MVSLHGLFEKIFWIKLRFRFEFLEEMFAVKVIILHIDLDSILSQDLH